MLVLHHLQRGQSERIVWLLEELGLPYELKLYQRDPKTALAPPELKALHPTGTAPILEDNGTVLGESGAIAEYIVRKYAPDTPMVQSPQSRWFADQLYWVHFANGYFQPAAMQVGLARRSGINVDAVASDSDPDASSGRSAPGKLAVRNLKIALGMLEERLARNEWLVGEAFGLADIMNFTTLTTMRLFLPYDLTGYDAILAYMQKVSQRDGYKRALEKGDPGFKPLLEAVPERKWTSTED